MIYPSDFEHKTGFDRLREQIVALCTINAAREAIGRQTFSRSHDEIVGRLSLADEMRQALTMDSAAPRGEFVDTDTIVDKIRIEGSFLDTAEIVALRLALKSVDELVGFILSRPETSYPCLREMSRGVESYPHIVAMIDSIVDEQGEVRDSASPELMRIRRALRDYQSQVSKRLQQVLSSAKSAGIVDADAMISIRDGRAVIPVSAANKRKLSGFIHDESATGRTFYVEPVEVVELNNALRELEYAQRREIVRILSEATAALRVDVEGISRAGDYLARMDALRAQARWAAENGAVRPIISDEGRLVLRSARHPLLAQTLRAQGREIVPLDMQLDASKRILVISGPNAGGKSVCLKTTGLLQYMVQCGFLVPTLENSEFPVFDSLMIDIGDQQSIDNDLSTYSSHLINMRAMLAEASPRTLVLIDEFGSGTEPTIGGAIAESILERLLERGAYGVITTHYANIKYLASRHEGVANGAMSFDVQQIRPLFRLETGKPGSSFAVEIARKIGLPEDIIRSAMDKAGSDHINLEKQLREIARDKRYWEQKRDRIRLTDRKVEELEHNYSEQLARIRQERTEILRTAKQQAQEMIAEANRTIENTIKTIREAQAEKELTRLARRELEDFGQRMDSDTSATAPGQDKIDREMERLARRRERREQRRAERNEAPAGMLTTVPEKTAPKSIEPGAKVRIDGQQIPGIVQSIKGKRAQVAFGQLFLTVDVERLQPISSAEFKQAVRPAAPRTVVSVDISQRKLNFKDHIDVRGMRPPEALAAVEDLIDDALMVGVSGVTILHGKGTGALKEEIRRYLKGISEIESIADEHADRGGAGITIVRFRTDI